MLTVQLPDSTLDAIADEVTRRVLAALQAEAPRSGRWLTGAKAAADYLGCTEKRIYNRLHVIPHSRDGGRLVFNTTDLDQHLRGEGAQR